MANIFSLRGSDFACIHLPSVTRLRPPIPQKDFPQLWKTCGFSDRYRPSPSMNLWRQVLDRLEQVVERTEYDTWFAPTRFLARKGDTVDIGVPSQRFIEEVRDRYGPRIRFILDEISPERVNLHFVADASDPMSAPAPPTTTDFAQPVFNPRYRFGSFVVGNSNQLAYAASKSISENPSGSFNPLFIYGGAGLGKTHLIQPNGHPPPHAHPPLKVVYISTTPSFTVTTTSTRS